MLMVVDVQVWRLFCEFWSKVIALRTEKLCQKSSVLHVSLPSLLSVSFPVCVYQFC